MEPRRTALWESGLQVLVVAFVATALVACSPTEEQGSEPEPATAGPSGSVPVEEYGPLHIAAEHAGVDIGAAVDAGGPPFRDAYRQAVAENFTSVTPENTMKWTVIRPGPDEWNWDDADEIVDFADQEGLDVRGHTLVWGQERANGLRTGWSRTRRSGGVPDPR